VIALLLSVAFAGTLTLSPEQPVHGEPVEVSLAGDAVGDALLVTYRPNSAVVATETLALTDGRTTWTPTQPGIAVLSVGDGDQTVSRNVSVRFASIPWSGVLVFLGTGLLLFGGATFAMRRMLQVSPDDR
jgi:hypothetical protein